MDNMKLSLITLNRHMNNLYFLISLDKLYEIVDLLEVKNISAKFFELLTFGLNDLFNEEYISDYENSIKIIVENYKSYLI